jgi:hypothetical protein
MFQVINKQFGTSPVVIHAHGSHDHKPNWPPIKNAFFATPQRHIGGSALVTVITCNNGHESMGMLEKSLQHLGVPYETFGQGISPWVNARDKPKVLFEGLKTIQTPYVLYADSRDAILIDDPDNAVKKFREKFQCKMLFGADRINWPPIHSFQKYEDALALEHHSDFRYFNGGGWIGETEFCRDFFKLAMATPAVEKAPESEQGILKKLFPLFEKEVVLDYHCDIIQNIGFVTAPIFDITTAHLQTLEKE